MRRRDRIVLNDMFVLWINVWIRLLNFPEGNNPCIQNHNIKSHVNPTIRHTTPHTDIGMASPVGRVGMVFDVSNRMWKRGPATNGWYLIFIKVSVCDIFIYISWFPNEECRASLRESRNNYSLLSSLGSFVLQKKTKAKQNKEMKSIKVWTPLSYMVELV